MIAAARWVKEHATSFGGNPDHIVLSGDSAGGNAINILLTANNGKGFPDLFVGAASESTSWGAGGYSVDRDAALMHNINSTGCASSADPIDCMRTMPISEFKNKTTQDGWGPTIDGELIVAPEYQMFEQGRFQNIPVIYGYTSNEATPNFISNQSINTDEELQQSIHRAVGKSITDAEVASVMNAYPASLNTASFFGRDVAPRANISLRQGNGTQWQRDAAIMTEMKQHCLGSFLSDMVASVNQTANYAYRYNVLDETPGGMADQGLFSPHTSELYAIWGENNTDGGDPGCLSLDPSDPLSCARGARIVQSYFISFMRTLNPNTYRLPGSPEWAAWTIGQPNRIVMDNSQAIMEVMGQGINETVVAGLNQRQRCLSLMTPLSKRINLGLGENQTLPAFANGTRADPTLKVLNRTGSACVSNASGGDTETVIIVEGGSCSSGSSNQIHTSLSSTHSDGNQALILIVLGGMLVLI